MMFISQGGGVGGGLHSALKMHPLVPFQVVSEGGRTYPFCWVTNTKSCYSIAFSDSTGRQPTDYINETIHPSLFSLF